MTKVEWEYYLRNARYNEVEAQLAEQTDVFDHVQQLSEKVRIADDSQVGLNELFL